MRVTHVSIVVACLAVLACNEPAGPDLCSGHIAIQVTPGTVPLISWTPACGVNTVVVVRDSGATPQHVAWWVQTLAGRIASPVQYGLQPAGTDLYFGPDTLYINKAYKVYITSGLRFNAVTDSLAFVP